MCTQEEKKPLTWRRSLDGTVYIMYNAENVPRGAGAADEQQMPFSAIREALGWISSTEKTSFACYNVPLSCNLCSAKNHPEMFILRIWLQLLKHVKQDFLDDCEGNQDIWSINDWEVILILLAFASFLPFDPGWVRDPGQGTISFLSKATL